MKVVGEFIICGQGKGLRKQGWGKFAHRPITAPSTHSGYTNPLYMLGEPTFSLLLLPE